MTVQKARLGSHCPQIVDAYGQPILKTPPGWQGLLIKETLVPGDAECGPQFTESPTLSFFLSGVVKRWYRSGNHTRIFENKAPGFDIYGRTYERDFGKWKGIAGTSLRLKIPREIIQRFLPEQAANFDLETRFAHEDNHLRELVLLLTKELKNGAQNGKLFAEGLSIAILGWLTQNYAAKKSLPHKEQKLSHRHQKQICNFIEDSLDSDLSVETMANLVGISPGHFAVLFRTTFGITPHQYVLQKRIDKAAELLRTHPEFSILDVAMTTGFSSQAHLTYSFKRYLQQTPARWKSGK